MHSSNTIRTNDGTKIWTSCYTPDVPNNKVIIIAPGIGLTHDYYHLFADFFCKQGFSVITFDFRGIGNSGPATLRGYKANMHQWAAQDINAVILYAKQQYSNQELIYIGHCIGGEIVGLAPASQYINKLVLISSALSCARLWPWQSKIRIEGMKILVRMSTRLFGYFPGKKLNILGNLPQGVIYEWANWCDNSNGLFDDFPDNNYRKFNVPILAITFSDDWHCPPRAVKELLSRFDHSSVTWYHMKPAEAGMKKIGHSDFFRLRMENSLWPVLLQWLGKDEGKPKQPKSITIKRFLNEKEK
ncbi:MAG TPA: alpha/beta fold hydrolase [Chitinophagaceae bacterium]|nr:alpha/beta fold hydrolase [Chitinophagaceae bacterium]